MSSNTANFLLLNAFDRSGSTLISKALANHPKVECLYNPFNSSVFRREFMRGWDNNTDSLLQDEARGLFNAVLSGNINHTTIKSGVFFENSSALSVEKSKLYVIKTTNLHLKLEWIKENFPHVPCFGLLRNPLGILASLVRNNFHIDWYGGWAYDQLREFIVKNYPPSIAAHLTSEQQPVAQMAVIIGVLNASMIKHINSKRLLKYEMIIANPNLHLNSFLKAYHLEPFDFQPIFANSINAVGKPYEGPNQHLKVFSRREIEQYERIFGQCGNLGYEFN